MIQRSSAQKSIDRENAPIQDQYFIFVLIIGYTLHLLLLSVEIIQPFIAVVY